MGRSPRYVVFRRTPANAFRALQSDDMITPGYPTNEGYRAPIADRVAQIQTYLRTLSSLTSTRPHDERLRAFSDLVEALLVEETAKLAA